MDILVSSNLERLIYLSAGCDAEKCAALMRELGTAGESEITDDMRAFMSDFYGGCATEPEVFGTIRDMFERTGYVIDPHTAVAKTVYDVYRRETGDSRKTVIASTASPFKFSPSVMQALGQDGGQEDVFSVIDALSRLSGMPEPAAIREVKEAEIRHSTVCEIPEMEETVERFLFG